MSGRLTEAIEFVRSTLVDVLPNDAPPSFTAILSAKYVWTGNRQRVIGRLSMFDGQPAVVECWQAGPCRAHMFTSLPGGSISWEDDRWIRCTDDGDLLTELPLFRTPAGRRALTEREDGE